MKSNSGLKVSMKTKLALHMMRVEIPESTLMKSIIILTKSY